MNQTMLIDMETTPPEVAWIFNKILKTIKKLRYWYFVFNCSTITKISSQHTVPHIKCKKKFKPRKFITREKIDSFDV